MLRGGTTTYCDMYYFEDAVARVTKEAGMRGVLAETIIDFPAPDNKTTQQAFDYTQKFLGDWTGDPLITAAVGPHSIYTLSEKTLQDSAALARRNHAPIAIHIAEAPFRASAKPRKTRRHARGIPRTHRRARSGSCSARIAFGWMQRTSRRSRDLAWAAFTIHRAT